MSDNIDNSVYDLYPKNIIQYWMDKDPEKTIDYIIDRHLSDVKKENGKYYMELSDLSDLKFLFRIKSSPRRFDFSHKSGLVPRYSKTLATNQININNTRRSKKKAHLSP